MDTTWEVVLRTLGYPQVDIAGLGRQHGVDLILESDPLGQRPWEWWGLWDRGGAS